MEYLQEITLDINTNTAYTTIGAKQGDNRSRIIKVHITNEGNPVDIDPSSQAYFRFKKPDGKVIVNTATIEDNAVRVVLTAQALAVAGRGYADITLQNGVGNISTVSFILIIMASPQISKEVESSNEFGYLNAVVGDATNIIYEAESWADGTRGGVAVASASDFSVLPSGIAIATASATPSIFMEVVGSEPGLKRTYTFTYIADSNWWMECESINGISKVVSEKELISNIDDYGITYTPSVIDQNDQIIVNIEEPDPAYQNNAKYYSEQANNAAAQASVVMSTSVRFIEQSLTDEQKETARSNINAQVSGDYITNPSNKYEGQYLTYGSDGWAASTLADYIINPQEKADGQYLAYNSSADAWYATDLPDFVADPSIKFDGQLLRYSNGGWAASSVSALDLQGIPSLLTSDFYGEELPTGTQPSGRIFFLKS